MRARRPPIRPRLRILVGAGIVAACGGEPVSPTETATQTAPTSSAATDGASTSQPTTSASGASSAPALPPIPNEAFEATDPRAFTEAAEEALVALLDHAAKSCPKKSPPEAGQLEVSP